MALYELGGVAVTTPPEGRYWVAPNAVLLGKVILEEDVSVWFGAVLRGDNEAIRVGARSNVQDGCVLHTDPGFPLEIGADCTIGHMVMLHGCKIGRSSLIGIGSILLNGSVIGEECLVGANTLIAEGKEQDQHEDSHLGKAETGVALELGRPRENEHRFDVEDHEEEGEDVVADLALRPSVTDRIDSAFVRRELFDRRLVGPHQCGDAQQQSGQQQGNCPEPDDRQVVAQEVRHRGRRYYAA